MIDIHTHLHFPDYDADRDAVIERARKAGVEKMILVGTDLKSSYAAVELAEKYDFLFVSIGIHPHFFNEIEKESPITKIQETNNHQSPITNHQIWIESLWELAKHPKVVAIGECGLDYFSRDPERPVTDEQKRIQKEGFLMQMEIAKEISLPMIIHTRPSVNSMDAYEDVFNVLKAESSKLKVVLHCYQGDTEITEKFLGLPNVYFSFAGNVTYPVKKALAETKDDIREVVKLVPINRLFIETDCPYLSPQERRGERNEPAFSLLTAEKIASIKGENPASSLDERVSRIFGF